MNVSVIMFGWISTVLVFKIDSKHLEKANGCERGAAATCQHVHTSCFCEQSEDARDRVSHRLPELIQCYSAVAKQGLLGPGAEPQISTALCVYPSPSQRSQLVPEQTIIGHLLNTPKPQ